MTKIGRPLSGKVLVKPEPAEQKTASGIIIPDSAKEKPQRGRVVAVGKPKKDEENEVSVDDIVLYGKYSGTEIKIDNDDYLILNQNDILLIIQ
ncbi:MAG: co-chaperone GroES [Bacteroidales bacterium]|nr:co-chaperone GroES [Bacteroidales bacterium]HOY38279.1 co-chaperone GroES [Bacteroidales bacterium]HQP04660.1 co-chaperone GroES [Bacteroidales bacterium]